MESRFLAVLFAPRIIFNGWYHGGLNTEQLLELSLENQSLKAELLELQNNPARFVEDEEAYVFANIYSEYPFNNSDRVALNAGTFQGVQNGFSAFVQPGIYFGAVEMVSEFESQVRTIFDPGWEIPVFIGENRVNALLIGGQKPVLTLIDKEARIGTDDVVYLSGKDFPYGATVGVIGGIESASNDRFERAYLKTSYSRNSLYSLYLRQ